MEQPKGKNKIIIILIIIVAALLAGIIALKIYQKVRDKKALQEAEKQALSAGANSSGNQIGFNAPKSDDDFPIEEGSKGQRVRYIQAAINRIAPVWKLTEDGVFGHKTYEALITGVGTRFYPVTLANYTELLKKSTAK